MNQYGYIGRKMRLPKLKEKPAIVIAAFGTSTGARAAIELFRERLDDEFEDHEVFWAWTSEIIRKKLGLPGLQQTLADVEASGYRRAVVQPLHIFPGTEYTQLMETCSCFPGLRTVVGETLMHRWEFVRDTLEVLEEEFISPEDGINILALHGTPLAADPVNTVYLGLEQMVRGLYPNVYAAAVEGVPDMEAVFGIINREMEEMPGRGARIIPVMYLAGLHAQDDLMGEEESWRSVLEEMGFEVDIPVVMHEGEEYFKGLAWYPEISDFFLARIRRSLELMRYF